MKTYAEREVKTTIIFIAFMLILFFLNSVLGYNLKYYTVLCIFSGIILFLFILYSLGAFKNTLKHLFESDQEKLAKMSKNEVINMNDRIKRRQKYQFLVVTTTLFLFGALYYFYVPGYKPVVMYVVTGLIVLSSVGHFFLRKSDFLKVE